MKRTVDKINSIHTREEFAEFLTDLCSDLKNNQAAWTNKDLPTFLEALSAWVRDMGGFYQNQGIPVPKTPEWSTLAHMLLAASMYE